MRRQDHLKSILSDEEKHALDHIVLDESETAMRVLVQELLQTHSDDETTNRTNGKQRLTLREALLLPVRRSLDQVGPVT